MRKVIDLIAIIIFGAIVVYIASVVSSNGTAAQYAVSGFWGGWAESPKTSTIAFWIVLVYLGLVVLTCSLCWKSPLLVLAAMSAVSIMVFVNPSYSVYICYAMSGPGHFIGDLLMPITSFCGSVIFGGQFAFENGYGWFVRLICVLFWSMGFLAIVAAPGEFFSELFSDSGATQSTSGGSARFDCSDEIDNLMRDAKMDRIQETLDDIKYWEIRNGGRK